ncbi:hypothetical protein Patl1_30253 [Pistacia atlantica]|uniref:Uncharacterized protein n=1 Tax=Pistacia atlantica TaxID=434234 RepID=A0ACC1A9R4_9ROSI|nr:hypothetical protein Patl1_30253 [Pistacia atlantica]
MSVVFCKSSSFSQLSCLLQIFFSQLRFSQSSLKFLQRANCSCCFIFTVRNVLAVSSSKCEIHLHSNLGFESSLKLGK